MKVQYSALFVDDMNGLMKMFPPVHPNIYYHHTTIEFAPKDLSNIEIGKKVKLAVIGRITTDRIDALYVENPKSNNRYPHITLSTANGVAPFESNATFVKHNDKIEYLTKVLINTTEGFFGDGKKIIAPR